MKALNFDKKLEIVELKVPTRVPGTSLVKVRLAGICNTDIEITRGYMSFSGILGHEFVGEVIESDREELVNKRVVCEINIPCKHCDMCKAGLQKHCRNIRTVGINGYPGVFADYAVLPDENLHLVPDGILDESAVFAEPLAAALHVQETIDFSGNPRVCVLGDGKLGLLISLALSANGVEHFVLGKHPERLAIAHKAGGIPINPDEVERYDRTFDIAVEATGNPAGFKLASHMVRPQGTIVLKSTYSGGAVFDFSPVVVRELRVLGSRCGPFDKAIALLDSGKLDLSSIIDGVYALGAALETFDKAKGSLKILLKAG